MNLSNLTLSKMASVFCCSSIRPYRPQKLTYEAKFTSFIKRAESKAAITAPETPATTITLLNHTSAFVIQVVRQVNYGPIEWKKYFVCANGIDDDVEVHEVSENDLIQENFEKLNSWDSTFRIRIYQTSNRPRYKNFKCTNHNKFFELNIYEKDPVNTYHWRANIARPAGDIDLPTPNSTAQGTLDTIPVLPTRVDKGTPMEEIIKRE